MGKISTVEEKQEVCLVAETGCDYKKSFENNVITRKHLQTSL